MTMFRDVILTRTGKNLDFATYPDCQILHFVQNDNSVFSIVSAVLKTK